MLDHTRFAKIYALHANSARAGERQAAATLARRQAEEAFLDDLFGAP